jgi:dinuclear metal center YbgI/SA1388 family protein
MTITAQEIAAALDDLLQTRGFPDYAGALNGLQFDHRGPVRRIAAAVDFSRRTIEGATQAGANFLLVHHGMFWGGVRPVTGAQLHRVRLLVERDVAVYASHLPLDAHPEHGNNVLLARALELVPTRPFAMYEGRAVGAAGECDIATAELLSAADRLARQHGGRARATVFEPGRRTRRWGICTGAGASSATLGEAADLGLDTLITGEGPHHTAVEAPELGVAVIYAGHYATETLGVCAVAAVVSEAFHVPWEFVPAPTGL